MYSQVAYAKHAPIVEGPEGKKGAGGREKRKPGPKEGERETQDHPKKDHQTRFVIVLQPVLPSGKGGRLQARRPIEMNTVGKRGCTVNSAGDPLLVRLDQHQHCWK